MAIPQLLVHDRKDTVGVVVIEGLKKGTDMLCVVTARQFVVQAEIQDGRADRPQGGAHRHQDGRHDLKYGQDIGIAKAKIGKGEHVHVHNVKTKRW